MFNRSGVRTHTTSKDLSVKQGLSRCLCWTGKIPHITHSDNHFQSFRFNLKAPWIELEKLNWHGQIILGLKVCSASPVIHPVTSKQKGQCLTQNNRFVKTVMRISYIHGKLILMRKSQLQNDTSTTKNIVLTQQKLRTKKLLYVSNHSHAVTKKRWEIKLVRTPFRHDSNANNSKRTANLQWG